MPIPAILAAILPSVFKTVEKVVQDKDKANEIQQELTSQMMDANSDLMKASSDVIISEIKGESWLQRNWRPLLMMAFIIIIFNNYIIIPYVAAFYPAANLPLLVFPDHFWNLLTIGVGGYLGGRSVEKLFKRQ